MGPPLKAAENRRSTPQALHRSQGFNGAAAKSSGKWAGHSGAEYGAERASMGPPLKAAENVCHHVSRRVDPYRFNGAAAKSSGKCNEDLARLLRAIELQWGRR